MSKTEQTTLQDGDDGGSDPIIPGDLEAAQVEIPGVQNINIEEWTSLKLTYTGKEFSLSVEKSDRVFDLKCTLFQLTSVPPERQKILGLVKGKLPSDDVRIEDLQLNTGRRFTLIGTPQGSEFKDPFELEDLPEVLKDLDIDFSANPSAASAYMADQRNHRKIKEAAKKLTINFMNPLREGKRLLVLDLDYTILDTKPLTSGALPPSECARPCLHEFLEAVYPYYDICIWSQTSWVWLETKLVELGMVGSDRIYKIAFVLDKTMMFQVFSRRDGKPYAHAVKALRIIWNHLPQFNERNTIHIDDLGRNFALNPNEGLKISAFKHAHTERAAQDRELDKLALYLVHIAGIDDFRSLNHRDWKKMLLQH